MTEIKVKCRKCGKLTKPEELVLDADYKMMVCPMCIKEKKKTREKVRKELEEIKKEKEFIQPVEGKKKKQGYDYEDEYLDKAHKMRMKETVIVEKIDDYKVKYTCPKCNYKFQYDLDKKYPPRCPYCDAPVGRIKY